MSNLDYPISVLEEAGSRISYVLQVTGVNQIQRTNQLDGIRRAIIILGEYKHQDEREERKKEKKKIANDKNIKL